MYIIIFELMPQAILPFFTFTEKTFLQNICPSPYLEELHFFGIMDPPPDNTIFHSILEKNLEQCKIMLQKGLDREVDQPYSRWCGVLHMNLDSTIRKYIRCKLWNGMNAMELAFLSSG